MSKYVCSVCKKAMPRDLVLYIKHTEQHIVDEIKTKHPDWVGKDGVCHKCVEYYRESLKGKGR